MKPYSYYTSTTVNYPSKSDYTVKYYYKRGKLVCVRKPFCEIEEVPPGAVEETIFDRENFELHEKAYLEEKMRLEQEFKKDLLESEGLTDNIKAEKCFSLAWDYGSSGGFQEIHDYFRELVQLIK